MTKCHLDCCITINIDILQHVWYQQLGYYQDCVLVALKTLASTERGK